MRFMILINSWSRQFFILLGLCFILCAPLEVARADYVCGYTSIEGTSVPFYCTGTPPATATQPSVKTPTPAGTAATPTPPGSATATATVATTGVPVDGSGCPLDTSGIDYENLDPVYFQSCSRCFATPTPGRLQSIPIVVIPPVGFPTNTAVPTATRTPTPSGTNTPTLTPTSTPTQSTFTYESEVSGHWPGGAWIWQTGAGETNLIRATSLTLDLGGYYNFDQLDMRYYRPVAGDNWSNVRATFDDGSYYDMVQSTGSSNWYTPSYQFWNAIPAFRKQTRYITFTKNGGTGTYFYIDWMSIRGYSFTPVSTPTPTVTPSPTATLAAWVDGPAAGQNYYCGVVKYRSTAPVAQFADGIDIHSYACYRIIPEIVVGVPGQGDVGIDGVDLCITWIDFPGLTFFGFYFRLDWLLVVPLAWLVRRLLSF